MALLFYIFITIFMISHFICVVLHLVFLMWYRYRVPTLLDKYGYNDLAHNMSYIIEKRMYNSEPFFSREDSKFEDKVWKEFYKLKLDKNKGNLYRIHKFYKFLSYFQIYDCCLWGILFIIILLLVIGII